VGDGEAGGEDGVVLGTYFHVLPGMHEKAVKALTERLQILTKGLQIVANRV
jgi:hypothetical protein